MYEKPSDDVLTFPAETHSGWAYIATITKYERYVVRVQVLDPTGKPFGQPKDDNERSFETLEEAKIGARKLAWELTPAAT